ncbi:ribosome-associated translation inhibitor RaiA [Candidatus Dojkabacteria bacterium]|nr:ribosome-associated translation inhibitor RaiA [Candidatus Dojkabacteria bacterium]
MGIQIDGVGMEITQAISDYIEKKFSKFDRFVDFITEVRVRCKELKASRGVKEDFKVEVTVAVPGTIIRVEKSGSDIYLLVDEIERVVIRKLNRYKELSEDFKKGSLPEKFYENIHTPDDAFYTSYIPKVIRRKKIASPVPMSEAEAIERMELADLTFFMFKNRSNNEWAVVYKRDDGTYGIVEP